MSFENYTDCLLQAFLFHTKQNEILKRKKEILDEVSYFHNYNPLNVLYVGFNPLILIDETPKIFVTEISETVRNYLESNQINFTYIKKQDLASYKKKIEVVVALDEYFTFAHNESEQKNKVTEICQLASEYVITTCRDYKNQEFKDKEFSIPALIKNGNDNHIYLEFHNYDTQDRNSWSTDLYRLNGKNVEFFGPFAKKIMYFKQLAKFSHDAEAVSFHIHKNLMYKSLIKKNYEHVISIRFDNGH